jgi:negative regulator of sigma E activity
MTDGPDVIGTPPPTGPAGSDDDLTLVSGYLDNELSDDERATVEARLADSEEWRDELDAVRVARDAVRALSTREAPAGFWTEVTTAVEAQPAVAVPEPEQQVETEPNVVPIGVATGNRGRRRAVAWIAGATAVAASLVAMFMIPGRSQVRPNVAAVATSHGATSAKVGDPISGLVPLGPDRAPR